METTTIAEVATNDHATRHAMRQYIALMRAAGYLRGIVAHGDEPWAVRGREIVAELERLGLYDEPNMEGK